MRNLLGFIFTGLAFFQLQGNNINWSSPPATLSEVYINAIDPLLAMDAQGNSVAAWIENNQVRAAIHPVNGNWTPDVVISGFNAATPDLVMDVNGNATLIWVESGIVHSSSKTLSGNWSHPTVLSSSGASSPILAVDASGDVVAAWVNAGNIETSTKLFGNPWQGPFIISSTGANAPGIAIGGSGSNTRVVLVWKGAFNGSHAIFTSTKLLSGSWTSPEWLSDPIHNVANPQVAVDNNASAIAVWYEYDVIRHSFTNVTVKSSERLFTTGAWDSAVSLSAPGIRDPSSLSANIAFDTFGNAMAVWNNSFDDETFTVQSAVKPVNGQWSSPQDIIGSNLYAYNESFSVTNFGGTLGLYMYYNGMNLIIQSVESNINGYLNNVWSVPVTISPGTDNATPIIAATVNNNTMYASAVWRHFNGVHNVISAVTGSKTLLLPPTNLNVTQAPNDFGVFKEYANTLTWNASADPNTVGYLVFRNGLFIQQVGAGVLQFVDDNRANNGPVTYSVTAIDADQSQSASVSVSFP